MIPGTRSPVLMEEKNPSLLVELMKTFCPEGGPVFDIYAGTLSTAVLCMMSDRHCIVVECDAERYRIAHAKLRFVARSFAILAWGREQGSEPSWKKSRLDTVDTAPTGQSITADIGVNTRDPEASRHAARDCSAVPSGHAAGTARDVHARSPERTEKFLESKQSNDLEVVETQ